MSVTAIVLLVLLAVLILGGMPVGFSLALASLGALLVQGNIPVSSTTLVYSHGSFALLAVPFFILAGEIIQEGGISRRLWPLPTLISWTAALVSLQRPFLRLFPVLGCTRLPLAAGTRR